MRNEIKRFMIILSYYFSPFYLSLHNVIDNFLNDHKTTSKKLISSLNIKKVSNNSRGNLHNLIIYWLIGNCVLICRPNR